MKRIYCYFCLTFSLLISMPIYANWVLPDTQVVTLSEQAKKIERQVAALPEQHFFSPRDNDEVKRILAHTINEQTKHAKKLQQSLDRYTKNTSDEHWLIVTTNHQSLSSLNLCSQENEE